MLLKLIPYLNTEYQPKICIRKALMHIFINIHPKGTSKY